MTINITERVIDALEGMPGPWDVMPGQFSARDAVCGEYATARTAHDVLMAAGYRPTGKFVATPPLDRTHDMRTTLRYSAGEGRDVLLARRVGGVVMAILGYDIPDLT